MALDISLNKQSAADETTTDARPRARSATDARSTVRRVLMPLASLKFTVVLFALAIFLVFTGTLVQKQLDIWQVIRGWFRVDVNQLFTADFPWLNLREMFVRIPLNIFCIDMFFPSSVWKDGPPQTSLGIWFPRGWLIGLFMGINLLAAHTVRFSIQAKGSRLWAGLGILALGGLATWGSVVSGSSDDGIIGEAIISWEVLWKLMLLALTATAFAAGAAAFLLEKHRLVERVAAAATALICGGLLVYALIAEGGAMLVKPEGMRILWQLAKGGGAGLILFAGCWLVFKKRAGIVLLHAGIGLMFLYEFKVGLQHEEAHMTLLQGTRSNWVQDLRATELAFTKHGTTEDEVTIVPESLLEKSDVPLDNENLKQLPFSVRVVKFIKNSALRPLRKGESSPATAGYGLAYTADELAPSTGTDNDSAVDAPAMYVELIPKSGKPETYLVSHHLTARFWEQPETPAETVEFDGAKYDLELRHKRTYKPYTIEALEVKQDQYVGGEKAKGYSSNVRVLAPKMNIDREVLIYMNNPMRFAGETFYQSSYSETPIGNMTTFSVVENSGWMLPYVSCMIVAVGMLAQFGIVLLRFLSRAQTEPAAVVSAAGARSIASPQPVDREEAAQGKKKPKNKGSFAPVPRSEPEAETASFLRRHWVTIAVVAGVALINAMLAMPPKPDARGMKLAEFGKLPVAYDSRVKPMDALARNAMTRMLDKQSFKLDYTDRKAKSQSALRWVLDLTTGEEAAKDYQIIRIENDELPKALGLEHVPNLSYSWNEIVAKERPAADSPTGQPMTELEAQVAMVQKRTEERAKDRTPDAWDREVMKVAERMQIFRDFERAFDDAARGLKDDLTLNAKGEKDEDPEFRATMTLTARALMLADIDRQRRKPPMPVPLADGSWTTVAEATLLRYVQAPAHAAQVATIEKNLAADLAKQKAEVAMFDRMFGDGQVPPALADERVSRGVRVIGMERLKKFFDTHREPGKQLGPRGEKFLSILDAYKAGDAAAFNTAVAEYRDMIVASPPSEYDVERRDWEAFMLRSEPFFWNAWMYLVAFCFAAGAWLGYRNLLNRVSFWIIASTFVVNTAALILRMYVTERPPVTNLYSSAVFIGWAAVLLGLILEAVYKNGFGNVVAALSGFGSLMVAWLLTRQGDDTIQPLEAVLDTTFWLATHVTCITIGYSTTYIAGLLGMLYVVRGVATPNLSQDEGKEIARMIYGTLCFALFFSFVGTVLGGLWADDSWGRFWGWDPKENGALIIVLWNALILHARWDGMVKDRGLAVLAVVGNITTSWSWFGVNQLGVGKHSYGFNDNLMAVMTWFTLASLLIAGLGMLPKTRWWSGAKLQPAK